MRNKLAVQLGDIINDVRGYADPNMGMYIALDHLRSLRVQSLEPAELKVYDYIRGLAEPVTSSEICAKFSIKANHASGILKALASYGLLTRELEINENGRVYIYSLRDTL